MRAYYFDSSYCECTLYMPNNLVVIENEEEDWFDIKYTPKEIQEFDWLWMYNRQSLLNNLNSVSVREVEVDAGLVKKFQDSCFSNNESSVLCNALKIFQLTKKEVERSCVN